MGIEPTFDADGYPDESWLDALRQWPIERWQELPSAMAAGWKYPEWALEVSPGRWVFATGGWSGNEAIIAAAQQSPAWMVPTVLDLPGGLYVIATTEDAQSDLLRVIQAVTTWAWSESRVLTVQERAETEG